MDNGFKILEKIAHAANVRNGVLTSNLANADTPGYKARDIDFKKIVDKEHIKLKTTGPNHISTGSFGNANDKLIVEDNPSWGDKNNVELDVEMAKMTENALIFESALQLMAVKIRMFKNAIKGR